MSNPKRKVTDLLPSEAILISSDADLKVLEEFEKVGYYWEFGEKPTQWNPIQVGYALPISVYSVADKYNIISFYPSEYNLYSIQLPATDFIPTESDEVEVSDTVMLSEVRNKLTPIKNLIAMLESGFIAPSGSQELIYKELKQCKINIEELTRNTPNQ